MVDLENLRQFLIESNKAGYAGGEEKKWIKESDGSTTIPFESGLWRSNDNFFGGEPYGGRVVVFFENKPVWMMVYYGWVEEQVSDASAVYGVLRSALMAMPENHPYRGPERLEVGDFVYANKWEGKLDRYHGEEAITQSGQQIYKATYLGGLVDQRKAV